MTPFSQPSRKPGRPQSISNESLQRRRNELLFVLEENWALIGWELQQADNASDLRAAFRRIVGFSCRSLELFQMDYRRETTFSQLEASRKRFTTVFEKLKEAQSNWEKCRENASLARSAFENIADLRKREELKPICEETEAAFAEANRTLFQLQTRLAWMDRAVQQREASFSQTQLLEFIASDRYTSTPLTFANAMAGLPVIRWRQSIDRCLSLKDGAEPGLIYRQFLAVAEVLTQRESDSENPAELMKARILQAKRSDIKTFNPLAENWYFLRRAFEFVLNEIRPPEDQLPYRVFAEFQRRCGHQGALDVLLKEKEVLTTPAYVKERRESGRHE